MTKRPVFHAKIGAFLAEQRAALGWTKSDAARFAAQRELPALTRQVLLRLEAGRTRHPDADVLQQLSTLYGVPYADLLGMYIASEYGLPVTERDLTRHTETPPSALFQGGGGEPAATRVPERPDHRESYTQALDDTITRLALLRAALAEDRPATTAAPSRGRRDRNTGG